ncbi:MAG: hypothetical protein M9915_02990 [Rhizobacter sp.]|nr:hypothetical protein [Rhizobacter sp.]
MNARPSAMRPSVSSDAGERVVGPRLLRLHRERAPGGSLRRAQSVALLVAEGRHAVQMGHVGGGVVRAERGGAAWTPRR